jgi:outer membrane protein assembly factor BamB
VGTPVIDQSTNTIYVVSKSHGGDGFHQRLHALNLSDGSEKFNGPTDIAFNLGPISFDPLRENQRCGLALVNGTVYIAYASHGDNPVYYGWILGYSASSLARTSVFNDDPISGYGGIWMSGGAPAADSNGNLFVITGNGKWDGNVEFGESFLKLSPGNILGVATYFTPENESTLSAGDFDLGSGGAAILIGQNLVIGGGKEGKLYLLNRDNMGGKSSGDQGAVQTFSVGNPIFVTPAFFQNTLYLTPINDHIKAYGFNSGTFNTSPSSQSGASFGFPGATPSISSQGSSNAIVWTIDPSSILRAFDAGNLGTELWNSTTNANDQPGGYVKFTVPTIANGKVYVGTASEISVYGLSPN